MDKPWGGGKPKGGEREMAIWKLKSVLIDVEKGIYEVNGKSIGSGCSELTLEFKEGEWSLALTRDFRYSTNKSVIAEGGQAE